MDYALIVSAIVNIVLVILSSVLAKYHTSIAKELGVAHKKLADLVALVSDFANAYADKQITRDEAQKLISDVRKLVQDP